MTTTALPQADEPQPVSADVTPATTVCPGQEALFIMRRSWGPVLARLRSRPLGELPLTGAATALVEDFAELRRRLPRVHREAAKVAGRPLTSARGERQFAS
ncbi:hypothetical protein ABZW30_13140 [Kitasatospora sp. NPDC004669]|uniref:hypothetical protein n=1 Tax=Kitasatospora sp. NPDC004669 TaxID=3154555 RepID=UPI0033AC3465